MTKHLILARNSRCGRQSYNEIRQCARMCTLHILRANFTTFKHFFNVRNQHYYDLHRQPSVNIINYILLR